MKFSDTATNSGLIQDCEGLLGAERGWIFRDSARLQEFTRRINERAKKVNSLIWKATGIWEYDDSNQTDLPIATTTLVNNQQDYELPSYLQKIMRVEILDINGNYQLLKEIDQSDIKDSSMSELYETAGIPIFFDLIGNSIFLYPKPDTTQVTAALGLKVYFSREIVEFNSTATTQEPGFIDNFHRMLSIGASLDYCIGYASDDVNRINNLRAEWNSYEKELTESYGFRNEARKLRISPSGEGIFGRY